VTKLTVAKGCLARDSLPLWVVALVKLFTLARPEPRTRVKVSPGKAMDWRDRSACLDEDPELFFPIGNTGPAILQIEEAKQVCRRCEVREQCLQWALEAGQDHGVWGGLSEDERRALKRRSSRTRVRTA
jgi:WhiB family redox-sensing transcriptional regulator